MSGGMIAIDAIMIEWQQICKLNFFKVYLSKLQACPKCRNDMAGRAHDTEEMLKMLKIASIWLVRLDAIHLMHKYATKYKYTNKTWIFSFGRLARNWNNAMK